MKKNLGLLLSHSGYWLRVVALGLVLGISLQFVRAWTEPAEAPPGGNLGAPLNTGNLGQYKQGGLILNTGGAPNGLIVQNGNVGIGTASPGSLLTLGDSSREGVLTIDSPMGAGNGPVMYFKTAGTLEAYFGLYSGIHNSALNNVELLLANSNNFLINGGNVGIGTVSPAKKLDVAGDVKGDRLCIGTDCRDAWPSGSGGTTSPPAPCSCWTGNVTGSNTTIACGSTVDVAFNWCSGNTYLCAANESIVFINYYDNCPPS